MNQKQSSQDSHTYSRVGWRCCKWCLHLWSTILAPPRFYFFQHWVSLFSNTEMINLFLKTLKFCQIERPLLINFMNRVTCNHLSLTLLSQKLHEKKRKSSKPGNGYVKSWSPFPAAAVLYQTRDRLEGGHWGLLEACMTSTEWATEHACQQESQQGQDIAPTGMWMLDQEASLLGILELPCPNWDTCQWR